MKKNSFIKHPYNGNFWSRTKNGGKFQMCSKPSLSLCIYLLRQFVTVAASLGLSRVQGRRRTDIQKIGKPMNST